jgi:hypothetical protein
VQIAEHVRETNLHRGAEKIGLEHVGATQLESADLAQNRVEEQLAQRLHQGPETGEQQLEQEAVQLPHGDVRLAQVDVPLGQGEGEHAGGVDVRRGPRSHADAVVAHGDWHREHGPGEVEGRVVEDVDVAEARQDIETVGRRQELHHRRIVYQPGGSEGKDPQVEGGELVQDQLLPTHLVDHRAQPLADVGQAGGG